ncbi:phage protein NinX family protein [Providencia stuartii]|uniref:phage protein NinX family protein n=1 Tax=Providencia stuartii TaxID=588 RepID=UPI002989B9A8|nr:phage protein NinX family protein [Providencia stuartii]
MNKYTEISDFEINKAVFHKAKIKHKYFRFLPNGVITYNIKGKYQVFDPCNNPADAMPIIKDSLISITHDGIAWDVSCAKYPELSVWNGLENYNDNFYRKAMELFLLIKDAENEKV